MTLSLILFLLFLLWFVCICNALKPWSKSGLISVFFVFFLIVALFVFYFFGIDWIIPTAYAAGSGKNTPVSESGQHATDMEYLTQIAQESVNKVVNQEYSEHMHKIPSTESEKIEVVYANFINSLMQCSELDLDERNEAMGMLKDTLVAKGFNEDLVNELVPMDPAAASDVTSSSSESESESDSEEDTLNSNQSEQQASDSSKSKQENPDIDRPTNKKRRIN